jgi:hypothetical protein
MQPSFHSSSSVIAPMRRPLRPSRGYYAKRPALAKRDSTLIIAEE